MQALIDTNILLYALDEKEHKKHEIARSIVKNGFNEEIYISAQNLGELCHKGKIKFNRDQLASVKKLAMAIIKSKSWVKICYTEHTIWNVVSKDSEKYDFWDLVIYFTMLENGVTKIITENEKDFEGLRGIEVINPFK